MERRPAKRFKAGNKYRARLIFATEFTIKNISMSGVCIITSKRLNTNDIYNVEMISKDKETILLTGEVSRSLLQGTKEEQDDTFLIYEVGIKFIDLSDEVKESLKEIISDLTNKSSGS